MRVTTDHTVLPAAHTHIICLYFTAARRHRHLAGTHCAYPRMDGQAELTVIVGLASSDSDSDWVAEALRPPTWSSRASNLYFKH